MTRAFIHKIIHNKYVTCFSRLVQRARELVQTFRDLLLFVVTGEGVVKAHVVPNSNS